MMKKIAVYLKLF